MRARTCTDNSFQDVNNRSTLAFLTVNPVSSGGRHANMSTPCAKITYKPPPFPCSPRTPHPSPLTPHFQLRLSLAAVQGHA